MWISENLKLEGVIKIIVGKNVIESNYPSALWIISTPYSHKVVMGSGTERCRSLAQEENQIFFLIALIARKFSFNTESGCILLKLSFFPPECISNIWVLFMLLFQIHNIRTLKSLHSNPIQKTFISTAYICYCDSVSISHFPG